MKILGQTLIILVAALAVIGLATALVGNSSFPGGESRSRPSLEAQSGDLATGTEEFRPRDHHDRFHEGDHDAPSLFGFVGVLQNFVIIGLIVGVVTQGPRLKEMLARLTGSFHNI